MTAETDGARSERSRRRRRTVIVAGAAGVALLGIVVGVIVAWSGGAGTPPSDGPIYLWDTAADEFAEAPGATFAAERSVNWAGDDTDSLVPIVCPADSTEAFTFISRAGSERTGISGWQAYSVSGFDPEPTVAGRLEVLLPVASLDYQSDGSLPAYEAVLRDGGTWSAGLACTTDAGRAVTGAFYRTVQIAADAGSFTVDPIGGK
ncbi:hypothetical protein SAMN05428970_2642 [Agromyces sp. CF514]|uniref:hypothetical protein n=1 Tax=Agromyces sp. CF514 TaxID=1881031 RepID=UPI0008F0C592|nr:hypothetical protein [Agromyces sp. CF514]SFR82637.1 hypothetical protein SAMN05428970_2642 [Agromyces sp. CF514]